MDMKKWLDRGAGLVEYFMAFLFLKGAWDVIDEPAVDTPFRFLDPLATRVAIVVYGLTFAVLAVSLVYGKLFRRRNFHGYALFGMYLVAVYIITLAWAINGWHNGLYLSIAYTIVMGALYLRWRYKVIFEKLPEQE